MNSVDSIPAGIEQPDVISTIYQDYYARVYKYTLYRVGNHSATEDLVSDVFEKVLAKYCTFNPGKAKLSTWLFTIVNNTITDYYRKNKTNLEPACLDKMESGYRLEELVLERELKETIVKAIICLNDYERNIISLKFCACLTNREIARMLNLTESNVGTILYRSLKRLRDVLKGVADA